MITPTFFFISKIWGLKLIMKITEEDIQEAKNFLLGLSSESNKLNIKGAKLKNDTLFIDGREVISGDRVQKIIREASRNPRFMGGRDRMFHHLKQRYFGISRRAIARFLEHDSVNQTHRPLKKQITSRPIFVSDKAKHAQIDLVDMQDYAWKNNGDRFILTYVDLFSKWVAAKRLKTKTAKAVLEGVKDIISDLPKDWRPKVIQSDNGGEFGPSLEKYLKNIGIKLIHSVSYAPQTQGAIERYNRELKTLIFRHMAHFKTKKWNDILPMLLENHNTSRHNTTQRVPQEVMEAELTKKDVSDIRDHIEDKYQGYQAKEDLEVGDVVRLAKTVEVEERKNKFRKRIGQNWSDELYEIISKSDPKRAVHAPSFLIKDLDTDERIKTRFYPYQMLKVNIEKLLHDMEEERPVYDEDIADRETMMKKMNRRKKTTIDDEPTVRVTRSRTSKAT